MEIRTRQDSVVIIDAGTGIRRLGNLLLAENKYDYTIIFTHVHWDHIIGLPFFQPIFLEKTRLTVIGCPFALPSFRKAISRVIQIPYFPVGIAAVKARIAFRDFCGGSLRIDDMTITAIALSHPNGGMGFRFEEGNRSFVYLTDNELGYQHPGGMEYGDYAAFSKGADLLIHDAEYLPDEYRTKKRWGHSNYMDTLRLALDAGIARLGLFHHNQDRTDEELDMIVEDCKIKAKGKKIDIFAVRQDMEIKLEEGADS